MDTSVAGKKVAAAPGGATGDVALARQLIADAGPDGGALVIHRARVPVRARLQRSPGEGGWRSVDY